MKYIHKTLNSEPYIIAFGIIGMDEMIFLENIYPALSSAIIALLIEVTLARCGGVRVAVRPDPVVLLPGRHCHRPRYNSSLPLPTLARGNEVKRQGSPDPTLTKKTDLIYFCPTRDICFKMLWEIRKRMRGKNASQMG